VVARSATLASLYVWGSAKMRDSRLLCRAHTGSMLTRLRFHVLGVQASSCFDRRDLGAVS
jgi:hypothetical protein